MRMALPIKQVHKQQTKICVNDFVNKEMKKTGKIQDEGKNIFSMYEKLVVAHFLNIGFQSVSSSNLNIRENSQEKSEPLYLKMYTA